MKAGWPSSRSIDILPKTTLSNTKPLQSGQGGTESSKQKLSVLSNLCMGFCSLHRRNPQNSYLISNGSPLLSSLASVWCPLLTLLSKLIKDIHSVTRIKSVKTWLTVARLPLRYTDETADSLLFLWLPPLFGHCNVGLKIYFWVCLKHM